jgi:hypothetical protein
MTVLPGGKPLTAINSPTGWIVGGAIIVLLLGGLFFYGGRDNVPKSGDNPPNVVTQSQPHK